MPIFSWCQRFKVIVLWLERNHICRSCRVHRSVKVELWSYSSALTLVKENVSSPLHFRKSEEKKTTPPGKNEAPSAPTQPFFLFLSSTYSTYTMKSDFIQLRDSIYKDSDNALESGKIHSFPFNFFLHFCDGKENVISFYTHSVWCQGKMVWFEWNYCSSLFCPVKSSLQNSGDPGFRVTSAAFGSDPRLSLAVFPLLLP